jgi:hypothetical protein
MGGRWYYCRSLESFLEMGDMNGMMRYQIYGLRVASDFPLQEEQSLDGQLDITIRNEPVDLPEMEANSETGTLYHISDDTIYLHWGQIGSFRIHAGSEISVTPAPGANANLFQRILTGAVLAAALYQRRRFILHASGVVVDGGAVLFSGGRGYGKSTIASGLHAEGHHLLADDIAAIELGETTHLVYPGVQEFKLWPDSVRNLGEREENLHRFVPEMEKRLLPVAECLERQPAPLKLIYMLDFGQKEEIERIPPAQATIEIVRNAYRVVILHGLRTVDFFQQAVRLAQSVPVYRLRRRNSLEDFDRFLAMVKEHLARCL